MAATSPIIAVPKILAPTILVLATGSVRRVSRVLFSFSLAIAPAAIWAVIITIMKTISGIVKAWAAITPETTVGETSTTLLFMTDLLTVVIGCSMASGFEAPRLFTFILAISSLRTFITALILPSLTLSFIPVLIVMKMP